MRLTVRVDPPDPRQPDCKICVFFATFAFLFYTKSVCCQKQGVSALESFGIVGKL